MSQTNETNEHHSSRFQEIPDSVYSGTEEFFSYFSQAQIGLSTLRLSLEDRIVASTTDLASSLEITKRTFQHNGKIRTALQDVNRLSTQLQQRIQMWEREVQNRERNKHGASGGQNQRLKAEIGQVRMRAQGAERSMSKLLIILYQMEAEAEDDSVVTPQPSSEQTWQASEGAKDTSKSAASEKSTEQAPVQDSEEASDETFPISGDSQKSTQVTDSTINNFVSKLNSIISTSPTQLKQIDAPELRQQAWENEQLLIVVSMVESAVEPNESSVWLWIIPKSIDYSVILAQQTELIACFAASSDEYSAIPFKLCLGRADNVELPRSRAATKLIHKIIDKRFSGLAASMNLLTGQAVGRISSNSVAVHFDCVESDKTS